MLGALLLLSGLFIVGLLGGGLPAVTSACANTGAKTKLDRRAIVAIFFFMGESPS
jgi:hypothetical protein